MHPSRRLRAGPRFALWIACLGASACASTADGTVGVARDAGAGDVTISTGPCAWRALPAVEVSPPGAPGSSLVDAVATADGAWFTYRVRRADGMDALHVLRVNEDARPHPATPSWSVANLALYALPADGAARASMLTEGDRVEVLLDGAVPRGSCAWLRIDPRVMRTFRPIDFANAGRFSLNGCAALLRTASGSSFMSEQVRAVWGTEVLRLDAEGALAGADELPTTEGPTQSGMTRVALDGGDFLAAWVETTGPGLGRYRTRARRFAERGAAAGEAQLLAESPVALRDPSLTRTRDGAFALWEGPADGGPVSYALHGRALGPDGAPRGETRAYTELAFTLGGVSVTSRGDEVLGTAITARDGVRLTFLALDRAGAPTAVVDVGLRDLEGPARLARVVATPQGALVFATIAQGPQGGRVMAVPMRCR